MRWRLSHRFDRAALPLADAHYNRQKPGTPQFVPPASCVVLLTGENPPKALWVSIRQKYVKHNWPGAWCCSCFRNEGGGLSSELIREAIAATCAKWGEAPTAGMITFVDPKKTRHKRDPGRCFIRAGFTRIGMTPKGLHVLRLEAADFPAAVPAIGFQLSLQGDAA